MTAGLSELPWLGASPDEWLAEAREFVGRHAQLRGLELVHERPWSVVLRAECDLGIVYLKATAPGGRHEPRLVSALAETWEDLVPKPLATDPARGWLLLEAHGEKLRDALAPDAAAAAWLDLLPRYAQLQRASATESERWLALGVPDRSPSRLPALLRELLEDDEIAKAGELGAGELGEMRAQLPELEACCEQLARLPHSTALDHGDLHDGNVLVRDGVPRLLDWGDACLAHPFCSLSVTLRTVPLEHAGRLRDAYLEPWTAEASRAELDAIFARTQWISHVGRALDWAWMLDGAGEPGRAEWLSRVAQWLRRWAAGPET